MVKQPLMRRVVLSLLPILAFAILNFGWKVLLNVLISNAVCFTTEWVFERYKKKKPTESIFVTGTILGLILPPSIPFWIIVVAAFFGTFFAKEVFGGFGRNVFNPAMVGRAFVFVSFPSFMTASWNLGVFPNGWRFWLSPQLMSGATPLRAAKLGMPVAVQDYFKIFWGDIPGSAGETAKWLIIIAAVYLVLTKTASFKIIVSTFGGAVLLAWFFQVLGVSPIGTLQSLISGGLLFATVFMATDPVSAPRTERAKWIYGLLIGSLTIILRTFSAFVESAMFAILIANMFAPLLDLLSQKKVVAK
uniref:RnfABCDGE type electron transport complex subunit D n=1 Tax=Pseudothermotoga hypogea TaxID=57487 RepID=A0A832IH64_9THEM